MSSIDFIKCCDETINVMLNTCHLPKLTTDINTNFHILDRAFTFLSNGDKFV